MSENKEIQKYRKLFITAMIAFFIVVIGLLIMVCIVVVKADTFNTSCVIAISVFAGGMVIASLPIIVLRQHRNVLVDKYYGKVTEEDIARSKDLLSRLDSAYSVDFLDKVVRNLDDESEVDGKSYKKFTKIRLNELSRGHKLEVEGIDLFRKVAECINSSPDEDSEENAELKAFTQEFIELLERNSADI